MSSYIGTSFADAIKLQKLDHQTFQATLDPTFAVGNGEYLESRNQPDTMTVHFEFISTTKVGPVIITVEDVKLGRQLSTLHLTLWQGQGMTLEKAPWVTKGVTKRAILAYATQTNLATFTGESLPMGFQYLDAQTRPKKPNLPSLLEKGGDDTWRESVTPKPARSFLKSNYTWRYFVPRKQFTPGVLDMWITPRNGEPITQAMLPYIVDSFPYDMHTFLMDPKQRDLLLSDSNNATTQAERHEIAEKNKKRANLWFPTVVMNLENKILLPKRGVRWLNLRITAKLMDNGKFDMDIMVRDEVGRTVALSHHVALIVNIERNTGGKTKESAGQKPKASL